MGVDYAYGQLHKYIEGSPVEIQTPKQWNPIGSSMTTPVLGVISQKYSFAYRHLIALILPKVKTWKQF